MLAESNGVSQAPWALGDTSGALGVKGIWRQGPKGVKRMEEVAGAQGGYIKR